MYSKWVCMCARALCVKASVRVVKTSVKKKARKKISDTGAVWTGDGHSGWWEEGWRENPDENSLTVVVILTCAPRTLQFYLQLLYYLHQSALLTRAMQDDNIIILLLLLRFKREHTSRSTTLMWHNIKAFFIIIYCVHVMALWSREIRVCDVRCYYKNIPCPHL